MFAPLTLHGIPLLNMRYSGAIKTGLYGIYLRSFGSQFTVASWRLFGILFVCTGIFTLSYVAWRTLPPIWLLSFLLLFLTDISVILATRHDWGPVALALLLRLLFVATWIQGEMAETTSLKNTFFLGLLVGVAIFEKLSSVVLLLPLALIVLLSPRRRSPHHYISCMAGSLLGGSLLIFVNIYSYWKQGTLISLGPTALPPLTFSNLMKYLMAYLSLGGGKYVKEFIFGTGSATDMYVEAILLGSVLLFTIIAALRYRKQNQFFLMSGIMLACYVSVGTAIFVLPRPPWAGATYVHHWILGTPFQYAAISFALLGIVHEVKRRNHELRFLALVFAFLLISFAIPRFFGISSVQKSFYRKTASIHYDPSLTKIGLFAANHANEANFIAADWGVATQIFCMSNGQTNLVYEPFWNYKGLQDLQNIIYTSGKKFIYIVRKRPKTDVNPENTARILKDVEKLPGWNEIPVESEISQLRAVEVRKFSCINNWSG